MLIIPLDSFIFQSTHQFSVCGLIFGQLAKVVKGDLIFGYESESSFWVKMASILPSFLSAS